MSRYQDVALCSKIEAEGFTIKNLKVPGHAAENMALTILDNIPNGEKVLGITPENYPYWPYKVRERFILNRIYAASPLASKMLPKFVRAILLEEGKTLTSGIICSLGQTTEELHPDVQTEYRARNRLLQEVLASLSHKELDKVWKKSGSYQGRFLYWCPVSYLPLVMAEIKAHPERYDKVKGYRYSCTEVSTELLSIIEKRLKEA